MSSPSCNTSSTDLPKQQRGQLPVAPSSSVKNLISLSSSNSMIPNTNNLLNRIKLFLPTIAAANQELHRTSEGYVIDEDLIREECDDNEEEDSLCITNTSIHDVDKRKEQLQQQQPKIEMNFVLLDKPMDPRIMASLEGNSNDDCIAGTEEDNGNNQISDINVKKRLIQEIS